VIWHFYVRIVRYLALFENAGMSHKREAQNSNDKKESTREKYNTVRAIKRFTLMSVGDPRWAADHLRA
ncbi:MAG: hypothetical protein ACRCWC_15860, partial [Plesiomonas shigelloides]